MIDPIQALGACVRITATTLAVLLAALGIAAGVWLGSLGVQLRSDVRNPKTPQARAAIFANPRGFVQAVQYSREAQVSGVETIHHFATACWRGLTAVVLLLTVNAVATLADRKKASWSAVLFAVLLLIFFFCGSWAASAAGLSLPVPADWPPAAGPIRGATMYAQIIESMETMKTVAMVLIATAVQTVVVFAALFWSTVRLFK
jgi:hypothetical protein